MKQNFDLILASSSPIRKKILTDLGLNFKIIKPDFDESAALKEISALPIKEQALFLARGKALSLGITDDNIFIISSDQICQLDKKIINKSADKHEAIKQLQKLNGKIHYQNNAVCLYRGRRELFCHFERAKLKMRKLSNREIEDYVNSDQSWNCAGSYKFESLGKNLFSEVKGNYNCILGMAIEPIINFLQQNKLIILGN